MFSIPWTDYYNASAAGPRPMRFKFVRDGRWMLQPNLQIGPDDRSQPGIYPRAGQSYNFPDAKVDF